MKCSARPVIRLYSGFDANSPTLCGPFESAGDCLLEDNFRVVGWFDTALPPKAGRAVVWMEPKVGAVAKWFFEIGGVQLLACKYFAQCGTPKFEGVLAPCVAEIQYPAGWPVYFPDDARRVIEEMRQLQAGPRRPQPNVIVFRPDLFSPRYAPAADLPGTLIRR